MQKGSVYQAVVTAGALTALLKKSFSQVGLDTQDFQDVLLGSLDEVVTAYEDFFKTLARQNSKLNKVEVLKCLSAILKGDASQLNLFAEKLCQAQRHCWAKSKQLTTGEKLADAVKRVALVYKKGSAHELPRPMEDLEEKASPSAGSKSTGLDEASEELQKAISMWGPLSPVKPIKLPVAESPMSIASSGDGGDVQARAPLCISHTHIYIYI